MGNAYVTAAYTNSVGPAEVHSIAGSSYEHNFVCFWNKHFAELTVKFRLFCEYDTYDFKWGYISSETTLRHW
jgi:hypothetical protein